MGLVQVKTALGYMKMATEISQQHFGLTPATVAVPEGNDDHDEDE